MSLFCSLSHLWCDRLFTEQERVVITELSRRCTSVWLRISQLGKFATQHSSSTRGMLYSDVGHKTISDFVICASTHHSCQKGQEHRCGRTGQNHKKLLTENAKKNPFYQNTLIAECHTNSQNSILQPDMFNEIWHILVVALNWCFTLTWSAIKLSTYTQVQRRQFLLPSRPLQEMYFYM